MSTLRDTACTGWFMTQGMRKQVFFEVGDDAGVVALVVASAILVARTLKEMFDVRRVDR